MSLLLLLSDFREDGTQLPAGDVIDTVQYPGLTAMIAAGLATIPYDGPSQDVAIAAFKAQVAQNPSATLLAVLVAHAVPLPPTLRDKFILAVTTPTVHSRIDMEGLLALAPLAGGALQAAADTRAELLRTAALAHGAGVATPTVDGEHKAADTTNDPTLAAIPPAVDLASCIALINGLKAWLVAHAVQAGVHFVDDSTVYTIPVDPPVTLADCIADLNSLKTSFQTHFDLGQPPLNP